MSNDQISEARHEFSNLVQSLSLQASVLKKQLDQTADTSFRFRFEELCQTIDETVEQFNQLDSPLRVL